MSSLFRLDANLRAAGIPIYGVSGAQGNVRVDYKPAATAQQHAQGDSIAKDFDWAPEADLAFIAKEAKDAAKASVDKGKLAEGTADQRLTRSIALALLDEVNTLRALQGLQPRTEDDVTRGIKEKIDLTPSAAVVGAIEAAIPLGK